MGDPGAFPPHWAEDPWARRKKGVYPAGIPSSHAPNLPLPHPPTLVHSAPLFQPLRPNLRAFLDPLLSHATLSPLATPEGLLPKYIQIQVLHTSVVRSIVLSFLPCRKGL